MNLDIRLPIGMLFTVLGALLAAFGLLSDPAIYARSLGINVNLWWGLALIVFGIPMLYYGRRAAPLRPAGKTVGTAGPTDRP